MSDPLVVHRLPHRYLSRFRQVRTRTEDGLLWYYLWECKTCGKQIKPNVAGAQSHIAWHVRKVEVGV